MLERVAHIKDEAFGRRVRERLLPSQEVLAQRVFRQSQELADAQRHLQRYHALVIALRERLRELLVQTGGDEPRLLALQRQLNDGLARALATESVDVLDVMDDMLKVVSAQVTLRPSGHQFAVEGHDTLLQAGLRAGMKLNYGCGNGTCGMCKVRVISGEVTKAMPFDYPLSEAEKQQGYTLACAHTAASSEITLETLEAHGPEDIAPQQIVTSVRALRELAPDTRLLHLQTPRSHRLRFLAGQSVTLGRPARPRPRATTARHLSDRQLPLRRPQPALLHRRATTATRWRAQVFDGTLKAGDAVNLWGPTGQFVLAEQHAPAGVRRLRHRLRAGQEPDRACAVAGHRAVAVAVLAGHAQRRALPGQPVPRLVGGAGPVRVRAVQRQRPGRRRAADGRGHARRPVRHRLRLLPGRAAAPSSTRSARRCSTPACRRRRWCRRSYDGAAAETIGCGGGEVFALRVLGDSMAPEFLEGEIIIVEPDGALHDGSFVLAQLDGEWTLRQLARTRRAAGACTRCNPAIATSRCPTWPPSTA